MFKNYLNTAWRNITRNPVSAVINIGGLAIGLLVLFAISIWILGELNYNKNFKNYDSIVQIKQHQTVDGITYTQESESFPLFDALKNEFGSSFEYIVPASWNGDHILSFGKKNISFIGNFMGPDIDRMLSLEMIQGKYGSLKDPNTVLLSESVAKLLFGKTDVLGTLIILDAKSPVKIGGVYKDLPKNCAYDELQFIAPFEFFVNDQPWVKYARDHQVWDNNSFQLIAKLAPNTNYAQVSKMIADIKYRHSKDLRTFKPVIFALPMRDWHLRNHFENGRQVGGQIDYVWLFGIIGVFVLLLACINFMNLSTARSEKRAKEVGIRKTLGSSKKQLIRLFYLESFMSVSLAFVLSFLLLIIVMPFFNTLTGKQLSIPWSEPIFWIGIVAFVLLTSFLAGSYPALFLSSFQPVKVLKGSYRLGKSATLPRKVLVVFQLTISTVLIIGTFVVFLQIKHAQNRPLGYNQNGLISFLMQAPEFFGKYEILRNDLKKSGAIAEMAESSSPITEIYSTSNAFDWEGKGTNRNMDFCMNFVTVDYGNLVQWNLLEGRDFSSSHPGDSLSIVINEAAAKYIGFKDPVGRTLKYDGRILTIIGVIKNLITDSPFSSVQHAVYFLNGENANFMHMRLNPNKSAKESLAMIEKAFKQYIPNAPFNYSFVDQDFAGKFQMTKRLGNLALTFSLLAVFLCALGLLGLTGFVAEQKTKEIGVRKVLGATILDIWLMLSKEFFWLVLIASLVAIPIGYGYMNRWLMQYEYKINLPWWIFGCCAILTVLITLLSVSYYGIKAAIANPVKSLRSE